MIGVTRENKRAIITLKRADKANALTEAMLGELRDTILQVRDDEGISAIILTGEGKTFSAGADLDEVRNGTLATSPVWEELSASIADCPILTIAALNGSLAGGAMGMVLACDLRISVPTARFFYPVMKIGVLPQPSDPGRLAALVGPARAKLILMGAERITAETAVEFGLVDSVHEDPLAAAIAVSEAACSADRALVASIKSLFRGPSRPASSSSG